MAVARVDLIIRPYSATAIQEWGRAISCKREWIITRDQRILWLIGCNDSSQVMGKLCDEAAQEDTAIACFYFDFTARNEQSPVNMLGSLQRQFITGLEEIPEVVARGFQEEKRVIGGRELQVPGILKMLRTITATKRAFICVGALVECLPEHRMVVLESLAQIQQECRCIRIFITGRSQVWSEVERKLDGAVTFIFIRTTEDGILRFLRKKLMSDTAPNLMSNTLKAEIMKSIPEINSETYVEACRGKSYPNLRADIFESRFLFASLHVKAILRGTTIARRRKALSWLIRKLRLCG